MGRIQSNAAVFISSLNILVADVEQKEGDGQWGEPAPNKNKLEKSGAAHGIGAEGKRPKHLTACHPSIAQPPHGYVGLFRVTRHLPLTQALTSVQRVSCAAHCGPASELSAL